MRIADCGLRIWVFAALILLLVSFSPLATGADLPTASTDRVPPEDWTYDALMHLSARGMVPGMAAERFMGDWLYDREQIAGFVGQALSAATSAGDGDKVLLSRLVMEFLPELRADGVDPQLLASVAPPGTRNVLTPTASLEPRIVRSRGSADLQGIYQGTAIAPFGHYGLAVASLSNRRRASDGTEFSQLDKLFIKGKTPNWEWEIGRDWLSWGPGYSGSTILSDNSPAFDMVKLAKDFYLGKHIGHLKITEFASSFEDNGRVYLLGRRIEKRFSKKLHFAYTETAKTTKRPNPLALVLPLYLYEHIYLSDIDAQWNSLMSLDATYRFSPRFEGYIDFLVDDMNMPSFLLHEPSYHRPRKAGLVLGGYWPDLLRDGTTGLRGEIILTDPGTYGATRPDIPDLAYTHDGLVIGNPVGGNSKAAFLRVDRKIASKWTGAAEFLYRRPYSSTGPDPENTHRVSLLLVHDLTSRASLTAYFDAVRRPAKQNSLQIGASCAF